MQVKNRVMGATAAGVLAASIGAMPALADAEAGQARPRQQRAASITDLPEIPRSGRSATLVDLTRTYRERYPDLTVDQARRRAKQQPDRVQLLRRLSAQHGDTFGGGWFDPASGVQHLGATTTEAATTFERAGEQLGLRIRTHHVSYSYRHLATMAENIRTGEHARFPEGPAASVDERHNTVDVFVDRSTLASLRGSGLNPAIEPTVAHRPASVVMDGCTDRTSCQQLVAGARITELRDRTWCTLGFTAIDQETDARYAVTAGHCAERDGWFWKHDGIAIGQILDSNGISEDNQPEDYVDAALLRIRPDVWSQQPGGWMYNAENPGTPKAIENTLTQLSSIEAGNVVCLNAFHNDRVSASPCAEIVDTSTPWGLRLKGFDPCGGDSGGLWYFPAAGDGSQTTAYGLHTWSSEGCHGSDGGDTVWFFPLPHVYEYWDSLEGVGTVRAETR